MKRFLPCLLIIISSPTFADDIAVKKIEKIVNRYSELARTFNAQSASDISPPTTGTPTWYRRTPFVEDIRFDVRKSDSLVSPLIAEISYSCMIHGVSAKTEAELKTLPDSFNVVAQKCSETYAYQSSRWVKKELTCPISEKDQPPSSSIKDRLIYQCITLFR